MAVPRPSKAPPAAASEQPAPGSIRIPQLRTRRMRVLIVGDTPLIVHAWSQKARIEMLTSHVKGAKGGRDAKVPEDDFLASMYRLGDGGYGFPSIAFKSAAVEACTSVAGMTKVAARQSFRLHGERTEFESAYVNKDGRRLVAHDELVRILGAPPQMREDMTRVFGGKADIRYRAQFFPWAARLDVVFNEGLLSAEQITNLLNTAGFGVGVGEWRPERDGQNGTFHVADQEEFDSVVEPDVGRAAERLAAE